jgi:hypothetical protein
MAWRSSILLIPLFSILFAGCSRILAARPGPDSGFNESSPEIRYETVDSSGALRTKLLVRDPLRVTYEVSAWKASQKSAAVNLSGGAVSNRVGFVFVGDGYTKSEMSSYANDVGRNLAAILSEEPFKTYANYFSFYRVDVISQDSGVSHESGAKLRTALDMTYGCGGLDRLLCANLNKVSVEAKNAPASDVVFALANSDEYGGAGYLQPAVATFAARNPEALELALHEVGHSFAGLGDEYDDQGVMSGCNKFANVAQDSRAVMQSLKTKWFRWLDLPNVSAFPGACYSSKFFRPTDASKMRVLGRPYEEVNTEQFILKIYAKVRPIDSSTPAGVVNQGIIFVKPMKPSDHNLTIEWALNGKILMKLSGQTEIDPRNLSLTAGKNTLQVTVVDQTPAVRDEAARGKLMTQRLSWTITH